MKVSAHIIIALTAAACLAVLAISVYPGALNDLVLLSVLVSFLVVPVAGVLALVVGFVLARKGELRARRIPLMPAAAALLLLLGTYVLLKLYVPLRIAFSASRASFEQVLPQATTSEHPGTPLNRRLGIYAVDAYAADPRGGVYFRVYSGADGISPDTMSYGFVYQPNQKGTPFGAARYRLSRLSHDWHWFRASDDWH